MFGLRMRSDRTHSRFRHRKITRRAVHCKFGFKFCFRFNFIYFIISPKKIITSDKHLSFNWFWLPSEKGKDSADKNNQNYAKWLEDGFIEETEGNVIDYDYIHDRILNILQDFKLHRILLRPV